MGGTILIEDALKIRNDFAVREHVPFESVAWVASPGEGVERKMLERDGGEIARATSIVRYARGSAFAEHVHERGEEFVVLDGTFEDEHGKYGAGTYVRNPPGSRHRPFSTYGCTIFVKLRQFADGDTRHRVVRLEDGAWASEGHVAIKELHEYASEHVCLIELAAGSTTIPPGSENGTELLVLRGSIDVGGTRCDRLTWLRGPDAVGRARSESGCLLWLKCGHLALPGSCAARLSGPASERVSTKRSA